MVLLLLLLLLLLPNKFAIVNGNNNSKFDGRTVATKDPQHGTENNPQEECKDTSFGGYTSYIRDIEEGLTDVGHVQKPG